MLFTLTNLSTGEEVEWPAHEGELIDYIGHWFPLSGNYRRDLPTRRTIYRLQWALRHGTDTIAHEDALGITAALTP